MNKYQSFSSENFQFLEVKFSIYFRKAYSCVSANMLKKNWSVGRKNFFFIIIFLFFL